MAATELLKRVRGTIDRCQLLQTGQRLVVGVSGGPDSLCLLHVLMELRSRYTIELHVAHLNHGLRGRESEADAAFVSELAVEWHLPATIESQDVSVWAEEHKLAIEEASRQVRYAFLVKVARRTGAQSVAVGHNADDQVETVIMHWLRGAGLGGLRGMLLSSPLLELRLGEALAEQDRRGSGLLLIRPLLETWRSDIEAYCVEHDLSPRFDRSNLDTTYYRNRLRHHLIPVLKTYNPRICEVVLRTARIIADDHALLQKHSADAWRELVLSEGKQAIVLDYQRWKSLPESMQRSLLREAIHLLRHSLRNINWVHIEGAIKALNGAHTGTAVTLPQGLEVRVSYDRLIVADKDYCEPIPDLPWINEELALAVPGETALPHSNWVLTAQAVARHSVNDSRLRHRKRLQVLVDFDVTSAELSLRPRRRGDRFCPQGMDHKTTSVSSFMINTKIPRAWRDRVPLLTSQGNVWWIAGWRIDERAKVTEKTSRVLALSFSRKPGN
jgi:tRNA(Ile)-lysidine synthase